MKSSALTAALLVLTACTRSVPDAGRAIDGQESASRTKLTATGAKREGLSLADFADLWSRRGRLSPAPALPEDAAPVAQGAEEQKRKRIDSLKTRALQSRTPSPLLRPGDRAGLREGDRAVADSAAARYVPSAEALAVRQLAAAQAVSRIHTFKAAMAQRAARPGASGLSPDGAPANAARLRPGDKVGARAGDLASQQRTYP